MTDLEQRIRDALEEQARSTPPPHQASATIRRTRRRQLVTVTGGALGALALVAGLVVGVAAVMNDGGSRNDVPATAPLTTRVHGISITHPEGWFVVDPDEAGLNSPPTDPPTLPRLVLALSPSEVDERFACPGLVEGEPPTFLMTVQERPLALTGDASMPWPVEPESLGGLDDTGCYPGWELLGTEWTAAGRTFEARIGFAPEVSNEDRQALLSAFASMTFEPATEAPSSVVLATGTAGGEGWELIAERQGDELVLTLQAESTGGGGGGFDPQSSELHLIGHVLGEAEARERVVFGALSVDAVDIEISSDQPLDVGATPVLDVPDTIDPRLNAFVFAVDPRARVEVTAFDDSGRLIARGQIGPEPAPINTSQLGDGDYFGFARSVDVEAGLLGFDVAEWLTGNAALEAAAERGDEVTNDYYIVNDDATPLTLRLSPDVRLVLLDWNRCCDATFEPDLEAFAAAVNEGATLDAGHGEFTPSESYWVTVRDGVVVRIEEQYRP